MPPLWHWAFSMPDGGDSFLPRIQSVFYAVFDVRQGPKIVYQVPEGLVASSGSINGLAASSPSVPPTPSTEIPSPFLQSPNIPATPSGNGVASRTSSSSLVSPTTDPRVGGRRNLPSPQVRSASAQRALVNFDDIHKYVIPPSGLCGRLVICSTQNHRIIGFPVALKGQNYERNYFRYNLCFVFNRGADLSCYEPIVRKVSRVLTACEEESHFLSSPSKSPAIYAILEQLYEDLNSYAETSIAIDQFNSIELKIFPFYPNPPSVQDWMVPLALIKLSKRVEDNWDLTMAKICQFIDGTNHVSRIAYLADCDIALTRQAISHLLYYQVIMTIDIFQYSNMYSLRKGIQWLADEAHVKEECGPYVTKPGKPIPDWPKLLHLYSRLKPGKTIFEWKEEYEVESLGIDIRRFTSFGVIKGFLQRVHRWPVYLPPDPSQLQRTPAVTALTNINASFDLTNPLARKRGHSLSNASLRFPTFSQTQTTGDMSSSGLHTNNSLGRTRPQTAGASTLTDQSGSSHTTFLPTSNGLTDNTSNFPASTTVTTSATHRARRASAAEKILEQLRHRDIQKSVAAQQSGYSSPRNSWVLSQQRQPPGGIGDPSDSSTTPPYQNGGSGNSATPTMGNLPTPTLTTRSLHGVGGGSGSGAVFGPVSGLGLSQGQTLGITESSSRSTVSGKRPERRQSLISPAGPPPPSPVTSKTTLTPSRPRISRSPSAAQLPQGSTLGLGQGQGKGTSALEYPPQLTPLLDGEHHTDELCVRFEVGWPLLERWLEMVGGGEIGSETGRVVMIYR